VTPVVWHPLALEDLHEAAASYKLQREGRDERFLSAVHRAIDRIRHSPLLGKPVYRTHRGVLVRRFPYTVIYRVRPRHIEIVAVAHDKRKPRYWMGRT
jgi:toxin ParE1/3/4